MNTFEDTGAYRWAQEAYAALGVDTEAAIARLQTIPISLHCWQGDDVGGFETPGATLSGGGIQVTGNYPGKARSIKELQADIEKVYTIIPGVHRLNLHASYGEFGDTFVDRDQIEIEHFTVWVEWAKRLGIGVDFNATCFSHPKAEDGFTLASKDPEIRAFWIEHVKRARKIAAHFGKELGTPSVHNTWIPDGSKDLTIDKTGYRELLKEALDEIFAVEYPKAYLKDAVETKLFGIGSESFVVGSHEFYMNYAIRNDKMVCLDLGHFHPTEQIADKISAMMVFSDEMLLHVSRPMRWDSDHVVILNDDIIYLTQELVRCGKLDQIHIGLDFFDATINRAGAWVTGARATQKGLLMALLEPTGLLKEYEESGNLYARLGLLEQLKSMPFGIIWDEFCAREGVCRESEVIQEVLTYEQQVLKERT
ncbi:MAG: L-rhamnose isomerase [Spirochaetia bacterium]|nr:L-rhamnose isomerase [Spirochaetia bacterium]MCF7940335.1 L-rhamnose isomerase [Spirochaetia bacterium]